MSRETQREPAGAHGQQELDELQRGQEAPLTVETMERGVPATHGESRGTPVPDPGERPEAIPLGDGGQHGSRENEKENEKENDLEAEEQEVEEAVATQPT